MFSSQNSQVSNDAVFVEDVFSTYLYAGNGSTQTITNGIDLSGKGGLIWFKRREATGFNALFDTVRGVNKLIYTNTTDAQVTTSAGSDLTAFNSNGFSLGPSLFTGSTNASGASEASWTFRKQPKFFDVVTWTGTGSFPRVISHSLGSTPGCIIIKKTSAADNWYVWHRGLTAGYVLQLDTTGAEADGGGYMTSVTSTTFSPAYNDNGATYVAYLFAHNAGGFGLTGTDNVISCGSFTTDGSGNATIDLGYEPQWWLEKNSSSGGDNWNLLDIARGQSNSSPTAYLFPNLSNAEASVGAATAIPTATGLNIRSHSATTTYIYIAIRRGPMKVPTSGTSVFSPVAVNNATGTANTTGFPIDLQIPNYRSGPDDLWLDRLRGISSTSTESGRYLSSQSTAAEGSASFTRNWDNTGFQTAVTYASINMAYWNFRRAPSFFDEVCYTGDGTNGKAYTHNLTVVPELVIVKSRSNTANWKVLYQPDMRVLTLNTTAAYESAGNTQYYFGNDTIAISPTSTQFTVSNGGSLNVSGATYVTYLFATCAGVSKVGSYTGNGSTQTINCGFTGGARFVLIKRTDSTGDWYVWDTARGIVSANDPYLSLNTTAAETTGTDYIDPYSAGFEISSTAPAAINASGGSFIFLAIA